MKKKVVVFGATGSLGAYTALELISKDFEVIAVGFRKTDNRFFKNNGAEYFSVDITNMLDFEILPTDNIYAVVHLAGSMPARMTQYNPQEYINSIITGTLNILEYTRTVNADRIVFSQSISDIIYAYGSREPIDPDIISRFPLNDDHSVYSICKNAAVNLIEHYYHKYGIKRFILRLPNIYLYHPNPFYYVNQEKKWQSYRLLIEKAKKGEEIEIWGDPNRVRDIIYVKDFTQLVYKSLVSSVDGGVYNAGTGIGTTLEAQIKGIIDVFTVHSKSNIVYRPEMPNAPQYILDISKNQKDLGYCPKYDYISYLFDLKKEMGNSIFEKLWNV